MRLETLVKYHGPNNSLVQHGNWTDLRCREDIALDKLEVLEHFKLNLGVAMTLPKWYRAELKPRSGTFGKYGLVLSNSIGEIEYDFAKEWTAHVIKITDSCTIGHITKNDRLFQFQISLRPDAPWYMKIRDLFISGFKFKEVDVLTTNRGGYGSTGR